MDTSQQVAVIPQGREPGVSPKRQRRSLADKRGIVEETLVDGASVATVERAHGMNANQMFAWRRLYLAGRLGDPKASQLGIRGLLILPLVVPLTAWKRTVMGSLDIMPY